MTTHMMKKIFLDSDIALSLVFFCCCSTVFFVFLSNPFLINWCATNGRSPKDVPDETYGSVKSWPAEAWKAVNDIDLKRIF